MPRLYHTKSRTGCARCRQRRVKCDEARPICEGCRRHNVQCVYDRIEGVQPVANTIHSHAPSAQSYSPQSPQSDGSDEDTSLMPESAERRLRELRLLHLWTVQVSTMIPGNHDLRMERVWAIDVPRLAMNYQPLLDAIMAFSILYMVRTTPTAQIPNASELLADRAKYLEATLKEHRKAMGTLSRQNADAASLTSGLLTFDAFASLRDRPLEPYVAPTDWLRLCEGVVQVFGVAMRFVRDDPSASINQIAGVGSVLTAPSTIFSEINRAKFGHLLLPQVRGVVFDDDGDVQAYEDTVDFLGAVLNAHESGEPVALICRKLLMFAVMFPSRFVDYVSARRPRALAILAHYFGLMALCTDIWLVADTPRREIEAISGYLGAKWAHLMEWPLSML